jgi:hypothetical protein
MRLEAAPLGGLTSKLYDRVAWDTRAMCLHLGAKHASEVSELLSRYGLNPEVHAGILRPQPSAIARIVVLAERMGKPLRTTDCVVFLR